MIDTSKFLINDRPTPHNSTIEQSPYYSTCCSTAKLDAYERQQQEYNLYRLLSTYANGHGKYLLKSLEVEYDEVLMKGKLLGRYEKLAVFVDNHHHQGYQAIGKYGWIIQEYIKKQEAWNKC